MSSSASRRLQLRGRWRCSSIACSPEVRSPLATARVRGGGCCEGWSRRVKRGGKAGKGLAAAAPSVASGSCSLVALRGSTLLLVFGQGGSEGVIFRELTKLILLALRLGSLDLRLPLCCPFSGALLCCGSDRHGCRRLLRRRGAAETGVSEAFGDARTRGALLPLPTALLGRGGGDGGARGRHGERSCPRRCRRCKKLIHHLQSLREHLR